MGKSTNRISEVYRPKSPRSSTAWAQRSPPPQRSRDVSRSAPKVGRRKPAGGFKNQRSVPAVSFGDSADQKILLVRETEFSGLGLTQCTVQSLPEWAAKALAWLTSKQWPETKEYCESLKIWRLRSIKLHGKPRITQLKQLNMHNIFRNWSC